MVRDNVGGLAARSGYDRPKYASERGLPIAFALASNSHGTTAVGLTASMSYPAASRAGELLTAEAREENKGGRTGLYTVEVKAADGTLVGLFHGTVYRRSDSLSQWMG